MDAPVGIVSLPFDWSKTPQDDWNMPSNAKAAQVSEQKLQLTQFSPLFVVTIRGSAYVLKVHHGQGLKRYFDSPDSEVDRHVCERTAYERLQSHEISKGGRIPRFYGTMDHFDLDQYQPHLSGFPQDEYPPKGILLEYTPNMRQLHWSNYTKERLQGFIQGLKELHRAKVLHDDR
ncbi:hypothetical protein BDV26DRAFT_289603 [Aspergillus bertholletiae]|uniref:Protein kinase domain-containing protein n=1 Tax=Aspergillus bertholletiae TaxID=1226010 RepID=A0A5N7BHY2_9EURO|nr:hypothetical protein BDV26DRAFT_289603 [Aspergillus bertholletiae]